MNQAVECYKCWRSQWHATGKTERTRRGILRAELVCDAPGCGYRFWSSRPAALAASATTTKSPAELTADDIPWEG